MRTLSVRVLTKVFTFVVKVRTTLVGTLDNGCHDILVLLQFSSCLSKMLVKVRTIVVMVPTTVVS